MTAVFTHPTPVRDAEARRSAGAADRASTAEGNAAPTLLLGVEDPDTRAHGIDESLHLHDWRNACLGEAYLFATLAGVVR